MSAPLAARPAEDRAAPPAGETDVWWGSYAGRAMAPSFAVCAVLTIPLYWGVHAVLPERWGLQPPFGGLAALLWLVQLARWSARYFPRNYRLTTRRLYVDRGFRRLVARRWDL